MNSDDFELQIETDDVSKVDIYDLRVKFYYENFPTGGGVRLFSVEI